MKKLLKYKYPIIFLCILLFGFIQYEKKVEQYLNINTTSICGEYPKSYMGEDINQTQMKVFLNELSLKNLIFDLKIICLGELLQNNDQYYFVSYSKKYYIVFSQVVIFILLLVNKKISFNSTIKILLFFQFIIQLIFNFRLEINMFNYVSIFSTASFLVILNEMKK